MRHTHFTSPSRLNQTLAAMVLSLGAAVVLTPASATPGDDAIYGRALPEAVHHVALAGVLVVNCESATLTSTSLVNDAWVGESAAVVTFDRVEDGSLMNCGTEPMLCMALDGTDMVWLAPGESILVGPGVAGYKRGCLCRCGDGVVFIDKTDCQGTCTNCNGEGPCIDPTNHQAAPAFTDCGTGWGPSSN